VVIDSELELFSWGYWGWGSATEELVQVVNAVERGRGYNSPLRVDSRISRSVRARGFNGGSFESAVGDENYWHCRDLGNTTPAGPNVYLKRPEAAAKLVDFARELSASRRRVIFFCSCERPRCADKGDCHISSAA
jgi:hypothetical protein